MMRRALKAAAFGLVASLSLATVEVQAGVITFTDRASWLTAVGPLSGTEDFNSFLVDTEFRSAAVALNMMSISGSSTPANGVNANLIDTPPSLFSGFADVDGTAFAAIDIRLLTQARIDFNGPFSAWGADFNGFDSDGTRFSRLEIYDGMDALLGSVFPSGGTGLLKFYGFELTAGQTASYIVFNNPGPGIDYFGVDNIGFVTSGAVPEPSTLALFALGLGCLGIIRRKRYKHV